MIRLRVGLVLMAVGLVVWGCSSEKATEDVGSSTTTAQSAATTSEAVSTITGVVTTTEGKLGPVVVDTEGSVTTGLRDGETVFTVTHDPTMFADVDMAREPDGVLASYRPGWHSYVWTVHEFVAADETHGGEYLQVEIHRLWPADAPTDVLWLTDYSGATRDILTGFPVSGPPPQSGTFELLDALVLEGQLDMFGLHNDCQIVGEEIGAALLSFEGDTPVPLMGWVIDIETRTFLEVDDPATFDLGGCVPPEPKN